MTDDPASEEAAVVGFVMNDVKETRWRICLMAVHGIVKFAVRVDPEDEFRKAVGQSPDRLPPATKVLRQKVEPFGSRGTIH